MKKFYVTGMVRVTKVGKSSGFERESTGTFERIVYADDAESARSMVCESVEAKWTRGSSVYSVKNFEMLSMEVFESVMVVGKGSER